MIMLKQPKKYNLVIVEFVTDANVVICSGEGKDIYEAIDKAYTEILKIENRPIVHIRFRIE